MKNQQFYIFGEQDGLKVGKQLAYVDKATVKIGKTPTKGKMYADGWVANTLRSKWSKDPQVNYKTLQNKLGFTENGTVYNMFSAVRDIEVVFGGRCSQEVGMSFFFWKYPNIEQS